MKTLITLFSAAALVLLGTTTEADAGKKRKRIHIDSYSSCGTPIYTERYVRGYDACGYPIFGYRTVRSHYQPVVRPYYAPVVRQRYVAPCPTPRYHSGYDDRGGYSRGGITIQGSFCR